MKNYLVTGVIFALVMLQASLLFWLSPFVLHTFEAFGFWMMALIIADFVAGFVFSLCLDGVK